MREAEDTRPADDARGASADAAPDRAHGLVEGAEGEACGDVGMADGGALGGHTQLSRPSAPQGRGSLFRR